MQVKDPKIIIDFPFQKNLIKIFSLNWFFLVYSNKYEIFHIQSLNELHFLSLNIFHR